MNGFKLFKRYEVEKYIASLSNSIPYDMNGTTCIEIEHQDANISLMFLDGMPVPDQCAIEVLLRELVELDEIVSNLEKTRLYFEKTGIEYELSYTEMESDTELALFYCGVDVNSQWGVEFCKNKDGKWEFSGFC